MTSEGQVMALFAKANPVPSTDLLDPIDTTDIDRLMDDSERSSEMDQTRTVEPDLDMEQRRRPILGLVAAGIMVVAAALVIIALANRQPEVAATPVEVSDAYMEAVNDLDIEAVVAFFRPGTETSLIEQQVGYQWWAFRGAVGELHLNQGCHEVSEGDDGLLVQCPFEAVDDLTRVLGLEPGTGQVRLLILDGQVQEVVTDTLVSIGGIFEAEGRLLAWVEENHPEDLDTMIVSDGSPNLRPESIALWDRYTDEFVAEMGG